MRVPGTLQSTPARVGTFVVAVALVGAAAYGVGAAVGPVAAEQPVATHDQAAGHGSEAAHGSEAGRGSEAGHGPDAGHGNAGDHVPGGLQVSSDGYTLQPVAAPTEPGVEATLSFQVLGPDGHAVTDFEPTHDEPLHLVVVRRDLTGYQHVHPEMAADGTWSIPLTLPEAGTYRAYADFLPSGEEEALTLGTDVHVGGTFTPEPLPVADRTATVDGYTVTLDGDLVPGETSTLTLEVSKDGSPVTDLEPYLAAYGHLVALRDGDLAYLHVHPEGTPGDGVTPSGPGISFAVEAPSPGDYRLFLDFQHEGVVRTAEFTVTAGQHRHEHEEAP